MDDGLYVIKSWSHREMLAVQGRWRNVELSMVKFMRSVGTAGAFENVCDIKVSAYRPKDIQFSTVSVCVRPTMIKQRTNFHIEAVVCVLLGMGT